MRAVGRERVVREALNEASDKVEKKNTNAFWKRKSGGKREKHKLSQDAP